MSENCINVDRLTGLPDGAALHRWLRDRDRAACDGLSSVVWIDIEGLPAIHQQHVLAGDEALRIVAAAAGAAAGAARGIFRIGPAEIAAVLPGATLVEAWAWADGVRQRVNQTRTDACSITLGIGAVTVDAKELDHEIFELAEAAAELARRWGGDRICTWDMVEVDALLRAARGLGYDPVSRREAFLARADYLLGPTQREQVTSHCEQVSDLATRVGSALSVDGAALERIRVAALLHELGMCVVPERLIADPDTLSLMQWAVVESHADLGAEMARTLDAPPEICALIRHHHRRYDQVGSTVPLGARIINVTDALVSLGPSAAAELASESGRRFDPVVVAAALRLISPATGLAA